MHFDFKEEQLQFADALKRWIGRDYGFEQRRAIVGSSQGTSDAAWAMLAELGMTALPVPEAQGGFDGTAVDLFVVMRELGRGLVVEPYFATVLGSQFLKLGGAHGPLLEQVAQGSLKLACALGERQARHDLRDIATRVQGIDGGWRLDGEKTAVVHGLEAGVLVVSARSAGGQRDETGITLFALPADAPGVQLTGFRTLDGQRAATLRLDGVQLGPDAVIGTPGGGWDILEAAADYGAGLLCAEALGAMEALFEA